MHAIGALCVARQVPVAPLAWVRRADNGYRGIFESDALERQNVLESNDIETMYVVSREYMYSAADFEGIDLVMRKSLASGRADRWSPHRLWHATFREHPADCPQTYYQRAMARYHELLDEMKRLRPNRK